MPGCCFVQVIQDGVCLSLDGMLSGVEINGRSRYNQEVSIPKRDIPKELRLSEQRHLVDDDPLKKAQSVQRKNPSDLHNMKVHLHVKCFSTYHTP